MADYQQSYQDFMLGRAGGGSGNVATPTSSATQQQSPSSKNNSPSKKSTTRRQQQQQRAFLGRLQEWIQLDEDIYRIVQSIHNLRKRIAWSQQYLGSVGEKEHQFGFTNNVMVSPAADAMVTMFGSSALLEEDVRMAYSADLRRHERMIAMLRSNMGTLSQTQDAMGRRLDELMTWMYEVESGADLLDNMYSPDERSQQCEQAFVMLSNELYAKQMLARKLFDSYDAIIWAQEQQGQNYGGIGPHSGEGHNEAVDVAKTVVVEWQSKQRQHDWWLVDEMLATYDQ